MGITGELREYIGRNTAKKKILCNPPIELHTCRYDMDVLLGMLDRIDVRYERELHGNGSVGEETCHIVTTSTDARNWPDNERCDRCGETVCVVWPMKLGYCPSCGARVVDE